MTTPDGLDWQRSLSAQVAGHVTEEQFPRRAPAEDPDVRDVDYYARSVQLVDGTTMSLSAFFGRHTLRHAVQESLEVRSN